MLAPAALALVCVLAPVARANPSPRIVNGTGASITDFPYQVALYDPMSTPDQTQFCGGVVFDATHVLTAAHCVVDFGTAISSPKTISVFAGSANLADTGSDVKTIASKSLAVDPAYDTSTNDHDIAMVELSSPLYGSPRSTIAPIPVIQDADFDTALKSLVNGTVSGWGCTDVVAPDSTACADFPTILQEVQAPLRSQSDCTTAYPFVTDNMFCAGEATSNTANNHDSCFGDSGGPLVVDDVHNTGHPILAGLVDAGNGCAADGFPGIYTRVSKLGTFINAADPSNAAPPSILGDAVVGRQVTCDPGTWSGATSFEYRFMRDGGGRITALTSRSSSATFTVTSALGGANIFCEVEATGTDALRAVDSAEVSVPAVPVQPPPPPPPAPGVVDTTAPTMRVLSKSCSKTSCTVRVRVADAAPSSGIGGVKAVLRWSRRCKGRGASVARTCHKRMRRTLKPKAGADRLFTILAKRLTPGTSYRLAITPFDRAGNKPQFSTITNVRTKPRHRSGLLQ